MKKHVKIYKTKVIIIVWMSVLAISSHTYAQDDCSERMLTNALEKFDIGKLDEVRNTLLPCVLSFKSDDEKFTARKVLVKIAIADDDVAEAMLHVKEMLRLRPDYTPNRAEESQVFAELVEEVKDAYRKAAVSDVLVTTATKRAQLSSDAPATMYVRTRKHILNRGYRNLIDLLEDIPEVEIQKNSISEFKNVVALRGIAGHEKFIIMIDGVRVTPSTGDPYTLGTNFSLANADRVEIILGPASALYGVDAFSGIINIITIDGISQGITLNTSYGRYNTLDNSILLGIHKNDVKFTWTSQYHRSQEPDFQNLYDREFSWYHQKYFPEGLVDVKGQEMQLNKSTKERRFKMPVASYFMHTKLNFGNFEIGGSRNSETHSSSISVDPRYTLYTKEAFIHTTLQSIYAKHIYKNRNDRWSLQSYLSSNDFVMDPETKFINRYTEYTNGYKYQFGRSKKIEEQWEYNISENTSCIAGISIENLYALPKTADLPIRYDPRTPAADQNIYYLNTDTVDEQGRTLKILQDFHYLNYQNYGTFFQWHTKRLKLAELTFGGRFDYNTRFGSVFNPRLGVVIKPSDKIKIKLLYGTSFLAPSPWKAYSTFGSFELTTTSQSVTGLTSQFFHIPNHNLKPEKLTSMESSTIFFANKNLFFSFHGYYNQINDLINIQSPQGPGEFKGVSVAQIETAVNQGLAHIYGLSFQVSYKQEVLQHVLEFNGAYAYIGGKVDGRPLVLAAKNSISMQIDWSHKKFSMSLRTLHRSASRSAILDSSRHFLTNSPYTVVNLFSKYNLLQKRNFDLTLSLRCNNLFNARYYHVAAGQDSFPATPQDPIRTDIGLSVNFKKAR